MRKPASISPKYLLVLCGCCGRTAARMCNYLRFNKIEIAVQLLNGASPLKSNQGYQLVSKKIKNKKISTLSEICGQINKMSKLKLMPK